MMKIDEARQLYERLLTQFPNSGRFWKLYIEQEVLRCFIMSFVNRLVMACIIANCIFLRLYIFDARIPRC